jgi:hypothetical protein
VEATELENLILGFQLKKIGFGGSVQEGGPVTWTSEGLSDKDRKTLLHYLRPFVLEDEPYSFFKIRNLIARSTQNPYMQTKLKEMKRVFGGQHSQTQMKIQAGDLLVNSEPALKRWLNAHEYHRDMDKAEALANDLGSLPQEISGTVFLMLLYQKADAIRYVGHVIFKILHAWDEAA